MCVAEVRYRRRWTETKYEGDVKPKVMAAAPCDVIYCGSAPARRGAGESRTDCVVLFFLWVPVHSLRKHGRPR